MTKEDFIKKLCLMEIRDRGIPSRIAPVVDWITGECSVREVKPTREEIETILNSEIEMHKSKE